MILKTRTSALLCSSIAVLAFAAMPAMAQSSEQPDDSDQPAEIIVQGAIITAQGESIAQKRNADNLIDISAADSVGRFPDQNSAAALSRLPAVAVQRDQGQERYIQVRGAPNRWTSVSIDGIPMIGVDEGGLSRAYRFDAVPAVLLSSLAINKSLTPNLQAEAIVANIDLRTFSPLAGKTGFHVQGDAGYGLMELGDGEQRQGSIRVSYSDGTFGVVAGASHYRREQVTDNREVGLYDEPTSAADTQFGPTEIDIRNYRLVRENNGLFAGLEYSPAVGQRLYLKTIYTEFKDDEQRDQYEVRLDRALSGTRNLSGGDLVRVPIRASFNLGEYRTRNFINTIGGDYEDNGWKVNFAANYTRTENTTYLPLVQASTATATSPSVSFDFSRPNFPIVQLFQTVPGATPGSFVRGPALANFDQTTIINANTAPAILIPIAQDVFSDSYTVKLDVAKELGDLTLTGGLLYADRDIDGFIFAASNAVVLSQAALAGTGLSFNPASYITDQPWSTGFPLGLNFNYVDNTRMRADFDNILATLQRQGRFNSANNVPAENRFALTEKTLTGYGMAKLVFDGGQVIAGARIEHFRIGNQGQARLANGTFVPLSAPQEYTDIFPSINARFDVTDNLVFRVAGQRGIARPSFGEIRVGSAINDTNSPGTISGGNPDLQPEYTWGVDASVEYYIPGQGILSVAGFHRWVDNVLFSNVQIVGSNAFDSNGIDRSGYLLGSSFNGNSGELYGVEFNYQQQFTFLPSPLDGFGFQGNLTLIEGSFDTDLRQNIGFPGTSDTIVNASLYYEKYGLSVRASYQWRSDYLESLSIGTGGGVATGDEFRGGYTNVDVAIRYDITPNISVFADLNNLTDAKYTAFLGTRARPTEVEQIGRRYLAGIRFGF
ncbi:TonB-dependent receptor [Blastomonas aquatica]|uniref:TonB-dependent receptor n=1 Tax=Blastomonas aquatica TaxID=1510276 RepID=A0ABQ1JRX1_9SPHN|nr:TonB-dependent receptor [Blastomonas aquatica]GGB73203.1 TonB-dependent receptor [Blastomonas aquatica]